MAPRTQDFTESIYYHYLYYDYIVLIMVIIIGPFFFFFVITSSIFNIYWLAGMDGATERQAAEGGAGVH